MSEFAPEKQAALDELKAFVRSMASGETIDLAALSLTGLPTEDEIDAGVSPVISRRQWIGLIIQG